MLDQPELFNRALLDACQVWLQGGAQEAEGLAQVGGWGGWVFLIYNFLLKVGCAPSYAVLNPTHTPEKNVNLNNLNLCQLCTYSLKARTEAPAH